MHAPRNSSLRQRTQAPALIGLLALALASCSDLPFLSQPTPQPVIIIATSAPAPTPLAPSATAATPLESTATPAPEQPTTTAEEPAPTAEPAETAAPAAERILDRVRARGRLLCGTNADLPGFGFYDNVRARWSGFDVDFCRAVAAAVLGDANAVDYISLDTSGPNERFEAIRSGRVDVLFRNTTWTLGRNINGVAFGPTTFHDGQTFMVRRADQITSLEDLEGKTICVAAGTTSEQNLNDDFNARGIEFTALVLGDENQLYPAYDEGNCDAVTSDSSQLASKREQLTDPEEHVILGDRISREPLGPALPRDDNQWFDVVSWVVFATIYAEELRIDQSNVERALATATDPRVRRLLGIEGNFGEGLGLSNDFAYQIVLQVGNYGDIYNRNLGPGTPFDLERGPNKVWNLGAGGVLASPPFR